MENDADIFTIQVALPESLKQYVEKKIATGGYTSASAFVGEAIREKLDRENAKSTLSAKLLEGLASGTPVPLTGKNG